MLTRVNADFARPAIVAGEDYRWIASPVKGVKRVMLDRIGGEKARATSIVRYAAHSRFPAHAHPGGEEILVLSGSFADGADVYPAGWYLRNPPGSQHQPHSEPGAKLFVKLWQMAADETQPVRIDTNDPANWQLRDNRQKCPLFASAQEQVCLQRTAAGAPVFEDSAEPIELLVLDGAVALDGAKYGPGSWIRLPEAAHADLVAVEEGATLYLKIGGLRPAIDEEGWQ